MNSSDSDDDKISSISSSPETKQNPAKRNKWCTPIYLNDNLLNTKQKKPTLKRTRTKCNKQNEIVTATMCKITTYNFKTTSPILGTTNNRPVASCNTSPILCNFENSDDQSSSSPVLSEKKKRKILKLGRTRLNKIKRNLTTNIELNPIIEDDLYIEVINSQPDIPPSSKTHEQLNNFIIDTTTSVENSKIECFSSENSSELTINSNDTIVPDSLETNPEELDCYYYQSPKRKRKYRPGTLSHHFHRILLRKKADVSIWKHELYLSSTSNYQIPSTSLDCLIIQLEIVRVDLDFGVNLIECKDQAGKCIIIIADLSNLENLLLTQRDRIQIHPPYYVKYFVIGRDPIKTYVNVHKIIKIK